MLKKREGYVEYEKGTRRGQKSSSCRAQVSVDKTGEEVYRENGEEGPHKEMKR